MKKKIAFLLVLLITLTASLSAQAVNTNFVYLGNISEQKFIQACSEVHSKVNLDFRATDKLPNPVIQAINNNLSDYSLRIGDSFTAGYFYQGVGYIVCIRITNARNSKWQFIAYTKFFGD